MAKNRGGIVNAGDFDFCAGGIAAGGGCVHLFRLMDIEKLIERLRTESLYADKASLEIMDLCMEAATALSTLQAENAQLRAELEQAKRERDAAVEAVKNMAEYIVCAGRVDYYLCDEISQEHHLKYQPKNDGNYDNEPCYKCIADWFLQGHKWQENC